MAKVSETPRPAELDAPLGQRLRDRRQQLGLTLKEVAAGAGLSVGFISQVERGLNAPSLSSLAAISAVLRTHVTAFLSQPRPDAPFTLHGRRHSFSIEKHALRYERISASFPGSVLDGVIIHKPPGHRSEWISHDGEELFYILEGAITVETEEDSTVLEAGSSIHFKSSRRHSSWNHGTAPAVILHVCTSDVFGDRSTRPPLPDDASDDDGDDAGDDAAGAGPPHTARNEEPETEGQ